MLDIVLRAAQAGAEALRRLASAPREVTTKGFRDFVTNADFASQSAILAVIRESFPDHAILTEESPEARQIDRWQVPEGFWWIIDPLDGTTNFQLGMPTYCVSVAVARGLEIQAGVLVDPSREMVFAAEKGHGATLNSKSIHVSARSELIEAVASADWPRASALRKTAFEAASRLGNACRSFRSVGSAALSIAYVASGWTDIYIHGNVMPWDCAAGVLIAQEAGAVLSRYNGQQWTLMDRDLLAVTPGLHRAAVNLLGG